MILAFWNFPCKNVSKSKMDFFKNGYLGKINQGSGPSRVSTGYCSFTLLLQITIAFRLKKGKFLKRTSMENSSWFKRGHNHNFKAQFIEDPLHRNSGRPNLGAFRILVKR
jgi:hypothetical protein